MLTRPNPYAQVYEGFLKQTEDHELHVLHDDGLYRHLRVQAPGTRMWSWDITTWPGHLAISGDVGAGYIFAREPDMLDFFTYAGTSPRYYADGAPSIDVRYWTEKIVGPAARTTKVYSAEEFLRQVRDELENSDELGIDAERLRARQIVLLEHIDASVNRVFNERQRPSVQERLAAYWTGRMTLPELFTLDGLSQHEMDRIGDEFDVDHNGDPHEHDFWTLTHTDVLEMDPGERRHEILADAREHSESEHEARQWLDDNESRLGLADTWEWDMREYDSQVLFACYCIHLAAQLYRSSRTAAVTPDPTKGTSA